MAKFNPIKMNSGPAPTKGAIKPGAKSPSGAIKGGPNVGSRKGGK
jgi:hypothetical protein